jgi:AcrR family transcriptional regulator
MNRAEKKLMIEEKIVMAIIEGLQKKELDEMSSDEIASRAEVSKRTLYKYFASKKEMYLGVVKYCFKELSEKTHKQVEKNISDDPYMMIGCIGDTYLQYCLSSRVKCKAITSFNENDYNVEFPEKVNEIVRYSSTFEISSFVERFYKYHKIRPVMSINSLSIYLWAHIQGLSSLLLSKQSWIESYYKVEINDLIKEHIQLGKIILLGVDYEKEV